MPSFPDSDGAAYRRGTVFGLTVAEVFILLLFLLMLLFLSLNQDWQISAEENSKVKDKLVEVTAQRDELEQSTKVQRDKIRTLGQQLEGARQKAKSTEEELATTRGLMDGTTKRLVEKTKESLNRAEQAENELERIKTLMEKGVNPPCWYQKVKVPDPDNATREREKPYYSFDIGVFDDHLIVRERIPPPGGAVDDNGGSYVDEARALNFAFLPYDRPLSNVEFERNFGPIRQAGKKAEVRSYPCIFWVRVWDKTAPGAKHRWKQAHDGVLEGQFGTYQVKDEAWVSGIPDT